MLERIYRNKRIKTFLLGVTVTAGLIGSSIIVNAKNASLRFGSEAYQANEGEAFQVGVYIYSDNGTGPYSVAVKYDPSTMEYVGGADTVDTENGYLYFKGDSGGSKIKYMVNFNTAEGNNTAISFAAAEIKSTSGEAYNVTAQGAAPIAVNALTDEEEEELEEEQGQEEAEEVTNGEPIIEVVPGQDESPQENEKENSVETATEETEAETDMENTSILYNSYFLIGAILIGILLFIQIVFAIINKAFKKYEKKEKQKIKEKADAKETDENKESPFDKLKVEVINLSEGEDDEQVISSETDEPVIEVDDVTMEFHLASTQTSGLKDYIIQFLKRQITYRKLFALYHVSFNVYRGEVVGIIGTNGSGKSTLLKIVSGALHPTEGKVKADRKKIQLLTLGTGFDMELTGRENVYLNGAIIGYSKKFLDEHYEEIVEFAELQDFMDEKVKNYSSGMVSRLGFAIATAGDAAEILILDEVLSVGDEFFRKKSLKRVKEMIHGGSTVLLVSHSMQTIIDNCTKCVWIEKGELRMVDEPKVVCAEYKKLKDQEAG